MFQRIHLSALLFLAARCVKGELSVSTGISRLTSISTPFGRRWAFSLCVLKCVHVHVYVHVCGCLNTFLLEGWVPRYITPDIINVQFGRRKKMERFTSSKHAPSCQSAPVRLAWFTRIRKRSKREEREKKKSSLNPTAVTIICLQGEKKETKTINLSWMFVLTGSGVVGTIQWYHAEPWPKQEVCGQEKWLS